MHIGGNEAMKPGSKSIKTNLLELLQAISSQTSDDSLVLAAMKELFASNRVRLASTLAPVRLVGAAAPVRSSRALRRRLH